MPPSWCPNSPDERGAQARVVKVRPSAKRPSRKTVSTGKRRATAKQIASRARFARSAKHYRGKIPKGHALKR